MAAALTEVLREALQRRPGRQRGAEGPTRSGGRTPAVLAVVIAVLLLGGGGVAAAYGIAAVSAFVTGNQTGIERLGAEVEEETDGITITVTSVEHTADFTRVRITVQNALPNTVSLPLYGNATFSDDETTLEADAFRSNWADTLAPRQRRSGLLVFPGHLSTRPTSATLAFAIVFEQGFDGPTSLAVDGIALGQV